MAEITTVEGRVITVSPAGEPVEMQQTRWRGEWYYREMTHVLQIESDLHGHVLVLVTDFMAAHFKYHIEYSYRFTGYWDDGRFCCFLADPTRGKYEN